MPEFIAATALKLLKNFSIEAAPSNSDSTKRFRLRCSAPRRETFKNITEKRFTGAGFDMGEVGRGAMLSSGVRFTNIAKATAPKILRAMSTWIAR